MAACRLEVSLVMVLCLVTSLTTGTLQHKQETCKDVHYHVQTLHQNYCSNKTRHGENTEIKEVKQNVATLEKIVQTLVGKQKKCAAGLISLNSRVESTEKVVVALKAELNKHIPRDCQEIKIGGQSKSGFYLIDPDGNDGLAAFRVKCDMSLNPAGIIIEHDYPTKTEVKKAGNGLIAGNTYDISYNDVSRSQLISLANRKQCSQFLRYDCHGSVITEQGNMLAYWVDRDGNKMNYWPGGLSYGCSCGVKKTCAGGKSHYCQCEKNDYVWRHDEGTITDDRRLPVKKLYFSDTDAANEYGHFTLGPLICY